MRVALAGNPNCGKTTLFNALTGSSRYVGNWPGVTVEKIEGRLKSNKNIVITDLPGIYSLTPRSEDETVSRNFLLFEHPDLIINIVDASRLERNFYLTAQLAETGIPMIVAFNMTDIVRKNGDFIDTKELSHRIGAPIIEISALKEEGLPELLNAVETAAEIKPPRPPQYSASIEKAIQKIEASDISFPTAESRRGFAVKILERDREILQSLSVAPKTAADAEKITAELEQESGSDIGALLANERYGFISRILDGCYAKKEKKTTVSDKIDRIVTDRLLSIPIFASIMFLVYFISITTVGAFLTDWTNDVFFGEWILPAAQSRRRRNRSRISSPAFRFVSLSFIFGGLRLYGAGSLHYAPLFQTVRTFREKLHSAVNLFRMRSSGNHGNEDHRKRKKPPSDNHHNDFHSLRCQIAGYRPHRRGCHGRSLVDGSSDLLHRNCRRCRQQHYFKENKAV